MLPKIISRRAACLCRNGYMQAGHARNEVSTLRQKTINDFLNFAVYRLSSKNVR